MSSLDHLIPREILEICEFDLVDLSVSLRAHPCDNQWPTVELRVDGVVELSSVVESTVAWSQSKHTPGKSLRIEIRYSGKTNQHTRVDDHGHILENQCVDLVKILVNGVDLVATGLIYQFGEYHMELDQEKLQYYQTHGLDTGPSHSLTMWENGVWKIEIPVPVLPAMIRHQSRYQPHEKWIDEDIYQQVYQCIMDIKRMEQKLKEK